MSSATHLVHGAAETKLASLIERINASDKGVYIDRQEAKQVLNDLYNLRKTIPDGKKNEAAKAIRYLEKLIYSCLLTENLKNYSQVYKREIETFSNPGTAQNKSVSAGVQISCGCSIADNITAIKGSGKLGYTRTCTTDTDDEGIVGFTKENKYQVTLGVNAEIGCTDEIAVQLGSEVSAKKMVSTGINYTGGAHAYCREKFSHKLFTYKNQGIRDAIFARKHTLLHHQRQAQNNQTLFEQRWGALTGKKVESKSPMPFQADVIPKRINATGYSANIRANAQFSSLASAGARLQYDFIKNAIEVDFLKNMFTHITSNKCEAQHIENLNTLSQRYSKAFSAVFNNSEQLKGKKISDTLSNDDIRHAVNSLNKTVQEYSQCVQKYCAGKNSEGKNKHTFEQAWGVKESGRYGFLQCAEVILATLATRLPSGDVADSDTAEIRQLMSQVNNKIANPEFTYDKRKLAPLLSFANVVTINNHSHTVTADLNASLGNGTIRGGGKVSLAVINKHVDNPYRIRAGEYRDIEITLTGNVTLANLLDKLTKEFASNAGVALSDLHSAVANAFSSTADASQGIKILVRYFSPDWSNGDEKKRNYTHQVTYLQSLKSANVTTNLSGTSGIVGGGISLGGGVSRTDVLAQKMGTDTLNYLMLRFNYFCGKPEEQPVWQRFVHENRSNLLSLMKNVLTPGTSSNRELDLLFKEKHDKTPESEREKLWSDYKQIRSDILSTRHDERYFDKGLAGLVTLMEWHKETTDALFRSALTPGNIAKPQKNIIRKVLSPFGK
ncbi:hypothetical protein C3432_01850 [Citrobacter amalonaticus]|uniref:Uncharacterized protein n=1 Tax=Citrobacter amalonaticus TaxID=35703 RepID=A0A2S4S2J6_CITAM|nr:hypothetical protein C3432_01850 [Citrobacter amalonaticus]POT77620.1 hypothetical protein C3436_09520 [Citrobacter amalonaticus]POU68072.1 hypothetical protein C3430_03055 [Citrobacter amalonaticus]POV07676.1 hypothetical protein C3424_03065 [Citrobacter amalonaticus]